MAKRRKLTMDTPATSISLPQTETQQTSFPIVGIGASAGGLEAFIQLLKHLSIDTF